jgi:hypothetical protein
VALVPGVCEQVPGQRRACLGQGGVDAAGMDPARLLQRPCPAVPGGHAGGRGPGTVVEGPGAGTEVGVLEVHASGRLTVADNEADVHAPGGQSVSDAVTEGVLAEPACPSGTVAEFREVGGDVGFRTAKPQEAFVGLAEGLGVGRGDNGHGFPHAQYVEGAHFTAPAVRPLTKNLPRTR